LYRSGGKCEGYQAALTNSEGREVLGTNISEEVSFIENGAKIAFPKKGIVYLRVESRGR
jgi:hypothetical protein